MAPKKVVKSTSDSDSSKEAKGRKVSVEKIIEMLKKGKQEQAITALEAHKKVTTKRAPSAFNLFIKEKMAEMKNSDLNTKDKMKKACQMWNEQKA